MSEMAWRKCLHCKMDRYCTAIAMVQHVEDCPARPSQQVKKLLCPKCGSLVERIKYRNRDEFVCVNMDCDYGVAVLPGGKLE